MASPPAGNATLGNLRSKITRLRSQMPYIPKTLHLVWQASGIWMVVWLLFLFWF
ncbi:MAG: hypothetical protein WCI01_06450 [Chlorobiaceae bacterium]